MRSLNHLTRGFGVPCALQGIFAVVPSSNFLLTGLGMNFNFSERIILELKRLKLYRGTISREMEYTDDGKLVRFRMNGTKTGGVDLAQINPSIRRLRLYYREGSVLPFDRDSIMAQIFIVLFPFKSRRRIRSPSKRA